MDDKTIIYIIGLSIVAGLFGELLFYFDIKQFANITQTATGIGRLGGIILLVQQGTLIKARIYFTLTIIFFAISIVGAITKIMHWPFNNIILITGLIGMPTIYALHFFKKQGKHRLDILKFLWVTIFYTAAIFLIHHFPFGNELKSIEGLLFLIMFADFAFTNYRTDKQ